jgi:coenzyme F420-reducing hydrogenase beta subunit
MIQLISKKDCCGCYACATICPLDCITMEEDQEGFRYPISDEKQCADCGLCEQVCPVINRFLKIEYEPNAFACQNKNEQIRFESSSGGIFTLLAEQIIKQNGVVFGARFNDDFSVVHDFTETIEGLEAFRGSKYVQSLISDNYKKAEQFLKQGREVLFTGTSCQIAGLKHFLQKNYANLLAVDIVCHGVPSPKVFRLYLEELNGERNGKLEKIQFRDKTDGWKKYSFVTKRMDGKNTVTFRETLDKNIYMKGFLQNLYLRPSCHYCPSKSFTSGSEITLADYWGIQQIYPEFDDDKGCSLVLCNNANGYQIFMDIRNEISFIETSLNDALRGNPSIIVSGLPQKNREKFFKLIDVKPLFLLMNYCTKPKFKERNKRIILRILEKTKLIALYKSFGKA